MKPKAIICDLDGTLCNLDHRLHFVKQKPKNWMAFEDAIGADSVNEWCAKILRAMASEFLDIILCSGRHESGRIVTQKWLWHYQIAHTKLFMRPDGDSRADWIIKEEILDTKILPYYEPLFVIDDRNQVVDMWRRRGLVCLQCAEGNY